MYEVEIRNGAMYLDEVSPGWRERVDPDKLEMSNCTVCVIGQITGNTDTWAWSQVIQEVGLNAWSAHEYGFSLSDDDFADIEDRIQSGGAVHVYQDLTEEWKAYIKATRSAK